MFASDFTASTYAVVTIDAATGKHTKVADLRADDQVLTGAFDGQWLVWTELHSRNTYFDWTLMAWDSSANKLVTLSKSAQINGAFVPGPVAWPAIRNGVVGWSQAVADRESELHLYSLAQQTDRVLIRGQVSNPVFVGNWLVWDYLDTSGQHASLSFADADSGKSVPVPAPLSAVLDPTMLAGEGDTFAWATFGLHELWAWKTSWKAPIRLVTTSRDDFAEFPGIAWNVVTFDGASGAFAADLRSGSFTQVTPQSGAIVSAGDTLAFNYLADRSTKSFHPVQHVFVVQARRLSALPHPRPLCH